jgi:iron complex transport system ATP-binding protein
MSGGPEPVLQAAGVRVDLGGTPIVRGADLEVRPGELVALLGPNGAGKSTLLGALAGDHRLVGGDVRLAGRDLAAWRGVELARHRAVLLQRVEVSFPFTARQVVAMGRAPWAGTPAEDDDDRVVTEAMAACDVGHLAERTFPTLSGGERARVALARVLAQSTGVLLLDEPTAALDLGHQELVLSRARRHADDGGAVLVVLHDLTLAAAWADRVVLMAGGRVVADGPPAAVFTGALLSEVYAHQVEVIAHPRTGAPMVLPVR